jgi:hypothetical protein
LELVARNPGIKAEVAALGQLEALRHEIGEAELAKICEISLLRYLRIRAEESLRKQIIHLPRKSP